MNGAIIPLLTAAYARLDGSPYGKLPGFDTSGWKIWPAVIIGILPLAIAIFFVVHLRRRGASRRTTIIWSGAISLPTFLLMLICHKIMLSGEGFLGGWLSYPIDSVIARTHIIVVAGLVLGTMIAFGVRPVGRGWRR